MPTDGTSSAENAPLSSSVTAAPFTQTCSTPNFGFVVASVPVTAIEACPTSSSPGVGDVIASVSSPGFSGVGRPEHAHRAARQR